MFPASQQPRYSTRRRPRAEDDDLISATQPASRARVNRANNQSSQSNNNQSQGEDEDIVEPEVEAPKPWTPYVVPPVVLTDASDSNAQFPGPLRHKSQADLDQLVGDLLNFVLSRGGSTSKSRNDVIKMEDVNSIVLANNRARGCGRYLMRDATRRLERMTGLVIVELPPKSEKPVSAHPTATAQKKKAAADKADKAAVSDCFIVLNPYSLQDDEINPSHTTNMGRRLNAERGLLLFVLDLVTWAFDGSIVHEGFLFTTVAEQCFGQSYTNFMEMKNHPLFGDISSLIHYRFVSQQYLERYLLQDASQASEYGGDGDPSHYHYRLGPRAYIEFDLESRFKYAQQVIMNNVVRPEALKEVHRKEATRKLQQGLNVVSDPSQSSASQAPLARVPASQQVLDLPEAYKTVLRHLLNSAARPDERVNHILAQFDVGQEHSISGMITAFNEALRFAQLSVKHIVYDVTGMSFLTMENNNQSMGQALPTKMTSAFTDGEVLAIKVILKHLALMEEDKGLARITRSDAAQLVRNEPATQSASKAASSSAKVQTSIENNITSLIELGWLYEQPNSFDLSIGVRSQTNQSIIQYMQDAFVRTETPLTCHTCKGPAYYAFRCGHTIRGDNNEVVRRCNIRLHLHCYNLLQSRNKNGPVKCPGGHTFVRVLPTPPVQTKTRVVESDDEDDDEDDY